MHSLATTSPTVRTGLPGLLPATVPLTRSAVPLAALRILGHTSLIIALLLINMTGNLGSYVFFAILTVMVLRSPESAFRALAICYLGLMINTFFVPKTLVWTPARILLPFLALLRFSIDAASYRLSVFNSRSYVSLLVFSLVMAVCSIMSGWYVHISLLKNLYFTSFLTLMFAAVAVLRRRRFDPGEWMVSLILATAVIGLGAIILGEDRNFRRIRVDVFEIKYGTMFNGAFVHPNSHSVYGPLFLAFLAIVWLFSLYRQRWLLLPITACWIAFIVRSASRTAVLASLATLVVLALFAVPLSTRLGWRLRPRIKRGTIFGLAALAVTLGLVLDATTNNSIGRVLAPFITKVTASEYDYQSRVTMDRIVSSRIGLIEFSWNNFLENPLFGIGLGVAKTDFFRQTATWLTAPAEKGFLPTAILEEGGIFGTAAFLLFCSVFLWDLRRERNIPGIIMFLTFLMTNFGEVTIFAPGGAGSFGWIMVGTAIIFSDRCWKPAGSPAFTSAAAPRPAGLAHG